MTKCSVTSGSGSAMMVVTAMMWMLTCSSVDAFHSTGSLALLHSSHQAARSRTRIRMTASSSGSDNPYTPEKLAGKTVLQRRLHILPTSITTPVSSLEGLYTLEERVRYQYPDVVDPQNPNVNPNPVGWHTFILRAPPSSSTDDDDMEPPSDSPTWLRLGPEVYRMDVHEAKVSSEKQTHHSGLGGQAWDTGAAMALYCAAHPSLFRECKKALELSCGSGFAGIMSTVAAGAAFWGVGTDQEEDIADKYFASLEQEDEPSEPAPAFLSIEDIGSSPTPPPKKANENDNDNDDVVDDAFPHHSRVPLPPVFKSLTMADESEDVLQQTFVNCKNSHWEPEQLFLQELDWTQRMLPKHCRSEFDVILACDVVYTFPDVKHASRAMAYALAPSPYDRNVGDKTHRGNAILHIGPHNRDSIRELKHKLTQGYKMSVSVDRIKVRTTMLQTTILDSSEKEMMHDEEAGNNGYIQYVPRSTQTTEYALLQAQHDEEYDGENGEWFFPAENGSEEQAKFKRDIEPDVEFGNYGARASTNPKTGTW
mmetsp:Transcript_26359/g.47812  ORF Transcript_26359/g.47812 Transcript_26359/m.47812 type:complete len:537 (-) Transcript_26359:176-1786(-)